MVMPFRGLRPKPELADKIIAPPYDVLTSDEARQKVKDNPLSFLRVNKPEVDFPPNSSPYAKDVYERGSHNLRALISSRQMVQDEEFCFYLYQLTWQGKSQTGLVTLCSVDEYESGVIRKHELTRPDKVSDRADHIVALKAQVGPVMMAFRPEPEINTLFEKLTSVEPEIKVTSDDVEHKLWVIQNDANVKELQTLFASVPHLYIADGHHRSESAAEVRRRMKEANPKHTGKESYNFFLGVIFPGDQMRILPYNRVISDFNGNKLESLLERAKSSFEYSASDKSVQPESISSFGLYSEGKWYSLNAKQSSFDPASPTASIGSAILEKSFFGQVLGITDVRSDKRVDFVGGIKGLTELERLVDSGKYKMAFSVFPVTVEQLFAVADAGEIMPPKSTWFEPKLKSGMVVHLFD